MVKVSTIAGNSQLLDGGAMFGNAPKALWSKWCSPDPLGRISLSCRSMLVEVRGLKVLCEVGIGDFFSPKLKDRFGVRESGNLVIESLEQKGIHQDDIDVVILSHLHFDHAGGLLNNFEDIENHGHKLLFPRAQIVVSKEAFERAKSPHLRDRASFIPEMVNLLEHCGRLVILPSDQESLECLPPEFCFFHSNGHTPGQILTVVNGEAASMVYLGDVVPGIPWVHLPITMGYDRFPELLIEEKLALYNKFNSREWLGFFAHDKSYSGGRIDLDKRGRYVARDLIATFDDYTL